MQQNVGDDGQTDRQENNFRRQAVLLAPPVNEPGNRFAGPAIVTEFDSTTVVLPGYVAEVDRYSNILITPEDAR